MPRLRHVLLHVGGGREDGEAFLFRFRDDGPKQGVRIFFRHAHQYGKGAEVRAEGENVLRIDAAGHDDVPYAVLFQEGERLAYLAHAEFLVSVAQGDDGGVGFPLEPYGHDTQFRRPAACAPDNIFRINAVSGYQA